MRRMPSPRPRPSRRRPAETCIPFYTTIYLMGLRRIAALFVMCVGAWAQGSYTVEQIKSFIRSAIQLKNPDKEVALTLRKMKLSERLDLNTVETLQGEGAGPRTVEALKELATESASLGQAKPPAPKPVYVPPPPPSSEEQAKVLSKREKKRDKLDERPPGFHSRGATPPLRRYHRQGFVAVHRCHHRAAQ